MWSELNKMTVKGRYHLASRLQNAQTLYSASPPLPEKKTAAKKRIVLNWSLDLQNLRGWVEPYNHLFHGCRLCRKPSSLPFLVNSHSRFWSWQERPIQSPSSSKKTYPKVYDHSAKVPLLENKNPVHSLGLGWLATVCFSLQVGERGDLWPSPKPTVKCVWSHLV